MKKRKFFVFDRQNVLITPKLGFAEKNGFHRTKCLLRKKKIFTEQKCILQNKNAF